MSAKFKANVKDGKIGLAYDGNDDGENSVTLDIVLSEATQSADLQEKLLQTEYDYEGEALGDAHLDPGRGTGHLLKDMPIPPVTPFWRTMAWVQLITGVVLMNVTIVAIFI